MKARSSSHLFGFLGAAFLGCTVILLVYWQYRWLPSPEHANSNQLYYWLVARDLSEYPTELRRSMLTRLEEEAALVKAAEFDLNELPEDYRIQLQANSELLRDDWFSWQLESYEVCPVSSRPGLLGRCLDSVEQWQAFRESLGEHSTTTELIAAVESLTRPLPPEKLAVAREMISEAVVVWLSREDLSEFSWDVRTELAHCIAKELDDSPLTREDDAAWSPEQQEQLKSNGQLLMEAWVRSQAQRYAELPEEQQADFVRVQMAKVQRWGVLPWLVGSTGDGRLGLAALMQLNRLFSSWVERAPESEQATLKQLAGHIQKELLRASASPDTEIKAPAQ